MADASGIRFDESAISQQGSLAPPRRYGKGVPNHARDPSTIGTPRFRSGVDPSMASTQILTEARSIAFHSISPDGAENVQHREVEFHVDEGQLTELTAGSRLTIAALDSSYPMAFDNDRFFGPDGYKLLLNQAIGKMVELSKRNQSWAAPAPEMGFFGRIWRWFVKFFMRLTNDKINRLRYTRGILINLPFQSGFESFATGNVVRAYDVDNRSMDRFNLNLAFSNINVSRVLVQILSRWDWLWHVSTSITWSRLFDFLGLFPFLGSFAFPSTENFPSTKNHALAGFFRLIFEGSWLTRYITSQQQGIVTFDRHTAAQNLAAQSIGFEASNRNQYGTFFGRAKTNEFRFEHRLTTDESIIRTFQTSPAATMVDNGVEHVLRCLAKHWRNMLYQDNGNFAHQRMEQLNPFEALRFSLPEVLHVLANLRGRNVWDTKVLGPMVMRLQQLNPDKIKKRRGTEDVENADEDESEIYAPCEAGKRMVAEIKENIVSNVCGGVPSRMDPLHRWLDAISDSLDELSREAEALKDFVAKVDTGINIGYQLLKLVNWHVPNESVMKAETMNFILKKASTCSEIPTEVINVALQKLATKDERMLNELIQQEFGGVEAANLLFERVYLLLERELRRKALNDRIIKLSMGLSITPDQLELNKWYWVETDIGLRVHVFKGHFGPNVRFSDVETNFESMHKAQGIQLREYIPIAEAISRAQKVYMVIELDYGKRFAYNCFMEFGSAERSTSLRSRLRRLVVLAQVHCSALDQARLNVLAEIRSSVDEMRRSVKFAASRLVAECKPQNVTVLGGGPTGLLSAIHCVQNVILTGGEVKLFEDRDTFAQEAASFERAQIVRLDPRQIAMIRYHLGTGYEDVFIPLQGERDPHMGNTLPVQGFVEITIKRMESMILDEVINMRSKNLLSYYTNSRITYDVLAGIFQKVGSALKVGDDFYNGESIVKVQDFNYTTAVAENDLIAGKDYDIVLPRETKVRRFRLSQKDELYDWYHFESHEAGVRDVTGSYRSLPPVYMQGQGRFSPSGIIVEQNGSTKELSFDSVAAKLLRLDFSRTHVVVAFGKPSNSPSHLYVTTDEPYAVCCIEGIKISMGMHNFGAKRFGKGMIDDIRSHSEQNTRIIGDFTKSVKLMPIVGRMHKKLAQDPAWQYHFDKLSEAVMDKVPSLHKLLLSEAEKLCKTEFKRDRLQTRFFELGNNFYLGMELPREYDTWKKATTELGAPTKPKTAPDQAKATRQRLQKSLNHNIDRLWYESCLEIIAEGDVYNPGGRSKIPQLYTIDSPFELKLGDLTELEAFRLFTKVYRVISHNGTGLTLIQSDHSRDNVSIPTKTYVLDLANKVKVIVGDLAAGDRFEPIDTFEIVSKGPRQSIIRNNSGGYIALMANDVAVGRVSDLSRAPNGYSESKVALASFPVAHVVSHRTLRINRVQGRGGEDGFITAFVDDAQASPHLMRYSGLTGAIINCMSINNLVGQALQGVSIEDRIQRYSFETNWSNGEVVQRGTGANYGEDGFLRPGFSYRNGINYLYDRALEQMEIGADLERFLTRDWKLKLAAALVPRGLETDGLFYDSLTTQLEKVLRSKFEEEVMVALGCSQLAVAVKDTISLRMDSLVRLFKDSNFSSSPVTSVLSRESSESTAIEHVGLVIRSVVMALKQTLNYAVELRVGNLRISSELFNQPKPVDSIVDDFAVEAQNFANASTESAAYAAATVALRLLSGQGADVISGIIGAWNITVSFGSMTNTARYRNRNVEMRTFFVDKKMLSLMKDVFAMMTEDQRDRIPLQDNPYLEALENSVKSFLKHCEYYNMPDEKINAFEKAAEHYLRSSKNQSNTISFVRQLVKEFIVDAFHVNSYLQQHLVAIYKELDDILTLMKEGKSSGTTGAHELFDMLRKFRPQLESSIERGDVKYGFIREHTWYQSPLPVSIRYLLGPFLCHQTIAAKTLSVLRKAESLDIDHNPRIRRPIQDLRDLYHATRESEVASMMVLSAFIVFCFSIFFSIFRVIELLVDRGWVKTVLDAASWAAIGSTLGSSLAVFHFLRKLGHLFHLNAGLASMRSDPRVRRVRTVALFQEFLVLIRLLAVTGATIALPWSVVVGTFGTQFSLDASFPAYVAGGAAAAAVLATFCFIIVEFLVRYNFEPKLGAAVCEPYTKLANRAETTQEMEREAWEYATRHFLHEYRFDTVFAAYRFGTIVQHLQSGNPQEKQ